MTSHMHTGAPVTARRSKFHSILCVLNAKHDCTYEGDMISYCLCEYLLNSAHLGNIHYTYR